MSFLGNSREDRTLLIWLFEMIWVLVFVETTLSVGVWSFRADLGKKKVKIHIRKLDVGLESIFGSWMLGGVFGGRGLA